MMRQTILLVALVCVAMAAMTSRGPRTGAVEVQKCEGLTCGFGGNCTTNTFRNKQCWPGPANSYTSFAVDCLPYAALCFEARAFSGSSCERSEMVATREVICDKCQADAPGKKDTKYFFPKCEYSDSGVGLANVTYFTDKDCKSAITGPKLFPHGQCAETNAPGIYAKMERYFPCGFVAEAIWFGSSTCSGEPDITQWAPDGGCTNGRKIKCI